jgi:hypothetical protein
VANSLFFNQIKTPGFKYFQPFYIFVHSIILPVIQDVEIFFADQKHSQGYDRIRLRDIQKAELE